MFCQSCGSQNSNDAKFCNQCGAKIAHAGDDGGPLVSAAATAPDRPAPAPVAAGATAGKTASGGGAAPVVPSAPLPSAAASGPRPNAYHPDIGFGGQSMLGVSLAGIGVRSSKKTWATILMIALALVALGALGSWLARGEPEVIAEAGHADPDDPFVIGTPLPGGEDAPVDFISGGGAGGVGATSPMTTSPMTTSPMTTSPMTTSMTTAMTTSAMTTSAMTTNNPTSTMTPSMTSTTPSMTTSMTSTMTPVGTMETTMETTMEAATMNPDPTDVPEERDLEMELYSSRVRFVIRRYYAARAQACFDRATRNNPSISGTVVINMTISGEGTVSQSRVGRNTTGDASLGQCLQNQVSTWRLPPPPGGSLEMQMPFSR